MSHLKEAAKQVRARLKKEFPECRFSVRQEKASLMWCLNVHLMKAPFQALTDRAGYHQLNRYQLTDSYRNAPTNNGRTLTIAAYETMKRVAEITLEAYPPDNQMTFVHFSIGRWDRNFVQIPS